jgi:hypothetical protein
LRSGSSVRAFQIMPLTTLAAKTVDDWRRHQEDLPGRPEAIRRLVEMGLKVKK